MTKTNRLRARVGIIAATTTLLLLGAVTPAIAGRTAVETEQTTEETPLPEGSNEHYAGSQIVKHEGRHGSPDMTTKQASQTHGMDVSGWQGSVNWDNAWANGAKFAYVKATEGTGFRNPDFAQQYNGSYNVGMIRGAYHFALPDRSTGAAQAKYFVANGGGWSKDGRTLPPTLDIEYNPYGATCYGLSQSQMVAWIRDFSNEVHRLTTRYPTIYTSTSWWQTCTGNNGGFGATNPLWIARYASSVGTLPNGWGFHTIWQYADSGIFPGDQNWFNGAHDRLQALANG
ncbi:MULTISPECIES: lysozyme [Actinoalloteichus]|uniref:Lysozyme n=1 Tax=Actinoalloteichus fjordicus TaxID=1612552 RepID=A0AAC9PVE0_9PSEU|nr:MULTISPECIES: lysozyme [Actinoalloteichus]APU17841.1 lysozyme M1 (1,4-beta-N-acetylmuramidase) [Actinoalloteichus fjordicus]APU23919.1 lysozyme M1 (1,4-beta-N-acetylmuramidase) [Actinoalloteichus sp. GBA129-24]